MSGRYYIVYFELFGKKMKTTIWATSQESAKDHVKDAIQFHKIDVVAPTEHKNIKHTMLGDIDMDEFIKAFGGKKDDSK